MLRQENRKFAFLDSYHRRKKRFGVVLKNAPWLVLIILHISVSINHGYIQQVHKAKDICIPAWLLSCLKCWQSHGSSDHTQTPKSIKASFNSYWILLEHFPKFPFFFLNIWVFTYTAVLPAQQQYLPRILNSILKILSFYKKSQASKYNGRDSVIRCSLLSKGIYIQPKCYFSTIASASCSKTLDTQIILICYSYPSSTQVHVKRQEARLWVLLAY